MAHLFCQFRRCRCRSTGIRCCFRRSEISPLLWKAHLRAVDRTGCNPPTHPPMLISNCIAVCHLEYAYNAKYQTQECNQTIVSCKFSQSLVFIFVVGRERMATRVHSYKIYLYSADSIAPVLSACTVLPHRIWHTPLIPILSAKTRSSRSPSRTCHFLTPFPLLPLLSIQYVRRL